MSPALRIADQRAGNAALVIEQLLDRGPLQHGGPGGACGADQCVIQNPPRDREPGRTERLVAREREDAVEPGTPEGCYRGALERHRPGGFEGLDHPQAIEQTDRLGAHVFGAGLITGEGGPIDSRNAEARPREQGSGGAARRSGADDEGVEQREGVS